MRAGGSGKVSKDREISGDLMAWRRCEWLAQITREDVGVRNRPSRNTYRGLILEKVHILRGALSVLKAASSAGCEMLKARRRNG